MQLVAARGIRASLPWAIPIAATAAILIGLLSVGGPRVGQSYLPDPLAPPNTSSPRATMAAVTSETSLAQRLMIETYRRHLNEPGWFMSSATERAQDEIRAHLDRAISTLDLSEVAPATRAKAGLETVLLLSEIFDRVGLPPADAISDKDSWTLPKTEIRIAKVEKGPRAGEFLFSPDTVSRAYEFYQRIRHVSPPDNFDFYAFYALSPGDLVPPKWYALIQQLPTAFHTVIVDSALWQWIALALTLCLALGFCAYVYVLTRAGGRLASRVPDWAAGLPVPLAILITIWLAGSFIDLLNFTGPVDRALETGFAAALFLPLTWLSVVVANRLSDIIVCLWDAKGYDFDSGILRVAIRMIGIVLAIGILAYGASQIGIPLVGIIAGLGVGGLAFALAAQPTLENFIGGIMIFTDRPVRVGDRCAAGDIKGVVEEIGIRSTRIRVADRSVMTVPNSDFAKSRIVNLSNRDRMLFTANIGLAYGTSDKQLRDVLAGINALLSSFPSLKDGKASFAGFGASSLGIDIAGELTGSGDLDGQRQDLLLKLFALIENAGVQLAGR